MKYSYNNASVSSNTNGTQGQESRRNNPKATSRLFNYLTPKMRERKHYLHPIQFELNAHTWNLEIHRHPFSTFPFLLYYNVFSMSILRVLQKSFLLKDVLLSRAHSNLSLSAFARSFPSLTNDSQTSASAFHYICVSKYRICALSTGDTLLKGWKGRDRQVLFFFYCGEEVIERIKKIGTTDLKEGFFSPARMITHIAVSFSGVYCVFNQCQTWVTHTHLSPI